MILCKSSAYFIITFHVVILYVITLLDIISLQGRSEDTVAVECTSVIIFYISLTIFFSGSHCNSITLEHSFLPENGTYHSEFTVCTFLTDNPTTGTMWTTKETVTHIKHRTHIVFFLHSHRVNQRTRMGQTIRTWDTTDSYTQTFTLQVDCLDVSRPVCSLRCCGRRTCKEKAQHKYFIDISNLQDQGDITIQLSPSSYSDLYSYQLSIVSYLSIIFLTSICHGVYERPLLVYLQSLKSIHHHHH